MFLRAVKPRKAEAVIPAAIAADETLAYFTPEQPTKKLRDLDVIEQMYGYWARD